MTDQTVPAGLTRDQAQAVHEWAERSYAAEVQDPTKPSGEGKPLTFRQFVAEKRRAASKKYDLSAAEAAQELPEGQFNAEYRDYLKKSFDQGADIPARHWNTLDEDLQRNLLRTPRALKDDSLTRKYRDMSRAKEPDAPKGVYDNKSVNSPDADASTPKPETKTTPKETAAEKPKAATADTPKPEKATADTPASTNSARERGQGLEGMGGRATNKRHTPGTPLCHHPEEGDSDD